jgi:hypothetical protein
MTLIENHNTTATNLKAPKCSAGLISDAGLSTDFDIPSVPAGVDALISSGVSNAPKGSIVAVTKTTVELPVYATSGGKISGLEISPAEGSGRKNGGLTTAEPESSSSSTSSSTASATSSSSSSTPSDSGNSDDSADAANDSDSSAAVGRSVMASGAALAGLVGFAVFAL